MPRKREREESDANFPDQIVQRHSVTSLETTRSLANGPSWWWGGEGLREKYVFCAPISLLSMGGVCGRSLRVCGRSLTAGKILFTGRQTCSLYLVL